MAFKNCCTEQDIRLVRARSASHPPTSPSLTLSLAAASISFTLGGSITTKTGNPLIVFHASTVLLAAAFVYVASYLPESFPEEKRNALSSMRPECSVDGVPATTRFAVLHIFEPFKMIIPTRRSDGTRNWRLAWCAAHIFVFTVASSYATDACLVLATTIYHLTPEDVSRVNSFRCKADFVSFRRAFSSPSCLSAARSP